MKNLLASIALIIKLHKKQHGKGAQRSHVVYESWIDADVTENNIAYDKANRCFLFI